MVSPKQAQVLFRKMCVGVSVGWNALIVKAGNRFGEYIAACSFSQRKFGTSCTCSTRKPQVLWRHHPRARARPFCSDEMGARCRRLQRFCFSSLQWQRLWLLSLFHHTYLLTDMLFLRLAVSLFLRACWPARSRAGGTCWAGRSWCRPLCYLRSQ